ncbi:MAG: SCO family protein [Kofleriaceae bacterium]
MLAGVLRKRANVSAEARRFRGSEAHVSIDDLGQPFTEEALRGHPTIFDFVFTRCETICPVVTMKMQRRKRGEPSPYQRVLDARGRECFRSERFRGRRERLRGSDAHVSAEARRTFAVPTRPRRMWTRTFPRKRGEPSPYRRVLDARGRAAPAPAPAPNMPAEARRTVPRKRGEPSPYPRVLDERFRGTRRTAETTAVARVQPQWAHAFLRPWHNRHSIASSRSSNARAVCASTRHPHASARRRASR